MTDMHPLKNRKWLIVFIKAILLFLFAGFCNDYILSSNSFLATIFVYSLLLAAWYFFTLILKKIPCNIHKELFFSGLVLLVLLLFVEVYLRFGVKTHLDFGEINGLSGRSNLYSSSMADAYIAPKPSQVVSYRNKEFSFYRKKNDKGLSEKNIPKKDSAEIRILCLGDSFTEGAGTSYDSSWVKHTEALLNETNRGNKFTLINAGLSGSDPFFEYLLLKNNLLDYKPDWVIMNVNQSDIFDFIIRGGMERFKSDGTVQYNYRPWWYQAYRYSYITRHIVHDVFHLSQMLHTIEDEQKLVARAIKEINAVGQSLEKLGDEAGFKFVMVLQPLHSEIEANRYLYNNYLHIIDNLRYTINLMPCFVDRVKHLNDKSGYYWPADTHFNTKGYQIMGECIFENLDSILIAQPSSLENLGHSTFK